MPERRQLAEDPGIADQNVELLPTLEDRRTEPVDAGEILQVEGDQRGAAAGRLDLVVEFVSPPSVRATATTCAPIAARPSAMSPARSRARRR